VVFGHILHKQYQTLEGFWTERCEECGAAYLDGTPSTFVAKCCQRKTLERVPNLLGMITAIRKVFQTEPYHLMKNGLLYNNQLAFGATGVENDHGGGFKPLGPSASVTIQGRMYHFFPNTTAQKISSMIGHLFFETSPTANSEYMDADLLHKILKCMKEENPIAATFCTLKELMDQNPTSNHVSLMMNGTSSTLDVSLLRCDTSGQRVLRITPRNAMGRTMKLEHNTDSSEAMTYPMLLQQGEKGWHKNMGVTKQNYIAARLLRCEFAMRASLYQHHMIR